MGNDGKRIATLNFNSCHYNYPEVMGIKIIEGTTLKKQNDLLVNEELVRLMKWTDGAVWPLYLQCVVDAWQHQFRIRTFKVHIDHRADHLRDMSDNL